MTWAVALKLGPWSAIALLLAALLQTRATLHDARSAAQLVEANNRTAIANLNTKFASDGKAAADGYAARLEARDPIIVHATDTVRTYAQTPAGRTVCATPDLVRSTDLLDQQLGLTPTAEKGR
jgi:hypothetical protein